MFHHIFKYRVPYPEVDRLNVVHHSHYAKYYEIGRTEAMRTLGWSYKDMEDSGIGLFVVEMQSKFLRPAKYDEVIEIHTTIKEMPGRRIKFDMEIYTEDKDTCNVGWVKLLFVDKSRMKVRSLPDDFKNLLLPYFND